MPELTNDAHERFAEEYLVDLNATAAYQRVYPEATYESAQTAGPRLLGNVQVAERVAELKAERAARVRVSADDVLRELMVIAFSDPEHYQVNELGHFELREGAPAHARRAVASVKHRIVSNGDFTSHEVEYRLWNKNDALKQLVDHLRNPVKELPGEGDVGDGVFNLPLLRLAVRKAEARRLASGGNGNGAK